MIDESIRNIMARRDGMEKDDIDALFEDAREDLANGADPDDVLHDIFGLEPDYFWDREFQKCLP